MLDEANNVEGTELLGEGRSGRPQGLVDLLLQWGLGLLENDEDGFYEMATLRGE